MVLVRYFFKRFFLYVFFITTSFTLLFNLIEFFEKMVRVKQTTLLSIGHFIGLNLLPSFFENIAIGSWLAACFLLKEMHQQHEWETLELLNINIRHIVKLLLFAGLTLTAFSFIGKELITTNLAQAAEQFKQKQFKQSRNTKLFNQWITINEKQFCHFNFLNLTTHKGEGFSLYELSDQFALEKIISGNSFYIDTKTKNLTIQKGTLVFTQKHEHELINEKMLYLPAFFTQLETRGETPSLKNIFHVILFDKNTLPKHIYQQQLYNFLSRLLSHLLVLLYPLLTFLLFFLFPNHANYQWFLIFIPYPLTTILFTITDSLMQNFQNGILAIFPYIILIFLIVIIYRAIRK